MSVQFGRWNFEGRALAPEYIAKVSATLAQYGPDSSEVYANSGVTILYCALHTTRESHRETQPHICPSDAVITWDGRLDNRAELTSELRGSLNTSSAHEFPDVEIVAAAYEKWGADCLGKLIGDWSLSIWNPRQRYLLLAKDPIGTKHLYYSIEKDHVAWSTILDPLVLFTERRLAICEEYIAGWLATTFPAAHLTPYTNIHAVPPSSSVLLQPGKHGIRRIITKYWDFAPAKRISYRTDAEYEEHFRTVFAQSVWRRLRSDRPVLAELSGGMDSSSIVCMADLLFARSQAECPRLDTISYYDDSDPNWYEERLYFTRVEQKRGRTGYHIDLGVKKQIEKNEVDLRRSFFPEFESHRLAATPDFNNRLSAEIFEHYVPYIRSQGYRVTLSGIGGEEPTGGFVPTPRPELQNLLVRGRFFTLAQRLDAWATKMRKPRLPLLLEAIREFCPLSFTGVPRDMHPPPWLHPGFVYRNRSALYGYPFRVRLLGPLPTFQGYVNGLNRMRRALAYFGGLRLNLEMLREVRYPYLDRDLLEFAYAIPREQTVGVGKRRFLMKRALVGIVPDELLSRKPRRPTVTQEPEKDAPTKWPSLAEMGHQIVSSSLGILNLNQFSEALEKARREEKVSVDSLKRALLLEAWLRHLVNHGVLTNSVGDVTRRAEYPLSLEAQELRAPIQPKKFS